MGEVEVLASCCVLSEHPSSPFEGHHGSSDRLSVFHIFLSPRKTLSSEHTKSRPRGRLAEGWARTAGRPRPDARPGPWSSTPFSPDGRQSLAPARCLPRGLASKASATPHPRPAPLWPLPDQNSGPWKALAMNPQEASVLLRRRAYGHDAVRSLGFQFPHQLHPAFHLVGATLPVLIITYKTVTVNFMASILSLQGSGAAHKLS